MSKSIVRIRLSYVLIISLVLFICNSCGGPGADIGSEQIKEQDYAAVAMIAETVIDGRLLGRKLSLPSGMALLSSGDFVLADQGNDRLIMFDSLLQPIRDIGGRGSDAGLLSEPLFISVDNGLNLLVSESGNRRVSMFDSRLNFSGLVDYYDPADPNKFGVPSGIIWGEYGEIWVGDQEENLISVFNSTGQFDRFVGDFGYSGGQLNQPGKLVEGDDENIIVCDPGNQRIIIYDQFGTYNQRISFPAQSYPVSVVVDRDYYWVVDNGRSMILLLSKSGQVISSFGPQISGLTKPLSGPFDILLISDNRIIISDRDNDRLVVCRILTTD